MARTCSPRWRRGGMDVAEVAWRVQVVSRLPRIRLSLVLVAVVLLIGTLTATASPAAAGKQPIGNVSCVGGGGLSFSPPLTPAGTRGGHEKITLTETLTQCNGGPDANVPPSPQSVRTKPIKLPATIVGGTKVVGGCTVLGTQLSQASVKQTITWGKGYQNAGACVHVSPGGGRGYLLLLQSRRR